MLIKNILFQDNKRSFNKECFFCDLFHVEHRVIFVQIRDKNPRWLVTD